MPQLSLTSEPATPPAAAHLVLLNAHASWSTKHLKRRAQYSLQHNQPNVTAAPLAAIIFRFVGHHSALYYMTSFYRDSPPHVTKVWRMRRVAIGGVQDKWTCRGVAVNSAAIQSVVGWKSSIDGCGTDIGISWRSWPCAWTVESLRPYNHHIERPETEHAHISHGDVRRTELQASFDTNFRHSCY